MLDKNFDQRIAELSSGRQLEYYTLWCEGNSQHQISRMLDVGAPVVNRSLKGLEKRAAAQGLVDGMSTNEEAPAPAMLGSTQAVEPAHIDPPEEGEVARFIFTSAQNNTQVNENVWENLKALATYYDAEIHVSQFTYVKEGNRTASTAKIVKGGDKGGLGKQEISYDPLLEGYESNEPLRVADDLVWCGELNILPTAVNPLSGMDSYTRSASSIFPHSKISLQSVATMKHEPAKFMYTTGCVTKRNYIPQKAGLKASFHHTYGAMLVEVDSDGVWFARQLNADDDGVIYDLDVVAEDGEVYVNEEGFTAYNPGDVHAASLCPKNKQAIWGGDGSVVDVMKPEYVMLHDLVDFRARNHHDTKDPHKNFKKFVNGCEDVREEMQGVANLLKSMHRDSCTLVVVDSNHDRATTRWLKESDFKKDPVNAVFYLECTLATYKAIENDEEDFHLVEWVMKNLGVQESVRFLHPDESLVVCGIQMGQHGDHGPNGSRGGPNSLKKLGEKINVGHYHSACIIDGLFAAGMNGNNDQGYNVGHSSWSASDIGTYPNGKRVIITKRDIGDEAIWRL